MIMILMQMTSLSKIKIILEETKLKTPMLLKILNPQMMVMSMI